MGGGLDSSNIFDMPEIEDKSDEYDQAKSAMNWTAEDRKQFIVATASAVLANIGTLVIVALAIIVARSFRPHPATAVNYGFSAGLTVYFVLGMVMIISFWFKYKGSKSIKSSSLIDKVILWIIAIAGTGCGFLTLLYLLGWLGFAAGVK